MRSPRLVTALACAALTLVGTTVPAAAFDVADLGAYLEVDTYSGPNALAWVVFNPDAPVQDVTVTSDYCDFGPAEQVDPGRWLAVGQPASTCYIVAATVSVGTPGAGEDDGVCAFVGLKKLQLKRGLYTDSYDPSLGAYSPSTAGDGGHVCSNRYLKLGDDVRVYGDAWSGYKLPKNPENVSGTVGLLEEPLVAEPVDPGDAWTENDNADIPLSALGHDPLDAMGNFEVESGDSVHLPPGVYLFETLKLGKDARLHISGPTTIYTVGHFKAGYGRIVSERRLPSDLEILGLGGKIDLPDEGDVYASVYAPTSKVSRKGDGEFFGSIVGHYVKLYGDGGYHYSGGGAAGEPVDVDLIWWMEDVAF